MAPVVLAVEPERKYKRSDSNPEVDNRPFWVPTDMTGLPGGGLVLRIRRCSALLGGSATGRPETAWIYSRSEERRVGKECRL